MNELALFAGSGGGILGGHILGWRTRCAVEIDAYARDVLLARQRDGFLPRCPIWDDVTTFDGVPWRGSIDIVSGGFPCTNISSIGDGTGIEGEASGLWKHMARIVGQVRPRVVWVENSPLLVRRGLAMVLGALASLGYNARWGIVGAHHAGAPHKRDRIWILAWLVNPERPRLEGFSGHVSDRDQSGRIVAPSRGSTPAPSLRGNDWWSSEPNVVRVPDGMAPVLDRHGAHATGNVGRVGGGIPRRKQRLHCIGNGQVPAAMILAWKLLTESP